MYNSNKILINDIHVNTIFSQNEQYTLSTVSIGSLSIQYNKCRMMMETTDRPMMTEQAWNG